MPVHILAAIRHQLIELTTTKQYDKLIYIKHRLFNLLTKQIQIHHAIALI